MALNQTWLLVVVTVLLSLTCAIGCRDGLGEREKKDRLARTPAEAATLWPGTRVDFLDKEGGLIVKLRQRKRGLKVFGPDRQLVGLVIAEGDQVAVNNLSGGVDHVLVADDAAAKKVTDDDEPSPKSVYTLFAARTVEADPLAADLPDDGTQKGRLEPDRNKPVVVVALFETSSGLRTWRLHDGKGELMAKVEQTGQASDDTWLWSGKKDESIALGHIDSASGGIEARPKKARPDEAPTMRSPRCKMPVTVLAPLLVESDDLLAKVALMQLLRCEGLSPCRDRAHKTPPPTERPEKKVETTTTD